MALTSRSRDSRRIRFQVPREHCSVRSPGINFHWEKMGGCIVWLQLTGRSNAESARGLWGCDSKCCSRDGEQEKESQGTRQHRYLAAGTTRIWDRGGLSGA